jgi:hypothetical protein
VIDDLVVRGNQFRPDVSEVANPGSGTHDLGLPPAVPMTSERLGDHPVAT